MGTAKRKKVAAPDSEDPPLDLSVFNVTSAMLTLAENLVVCFTEKASPDGGDNDAAFSAGSQARIANSPHAAALG